MQVTFRIPSRVAITPKTIAWYYPMPIALGVQRLARTVEPTGKLVALRYAFESTVRHLVAIGVSDVLYCADRATDHQHRLLDAFKAEAFDFLTKPVDKCEPQTLGRWVQALRGVCSVLAGCEGRFVEELPCLCKPDGELDKKILSAIVRQRNFVEHLDNSVALTADETREVIDVLVARFNEVLMLFDFLLKYPLCFVRRAVTPPNRNGLIAYDAYSCMGSKIGGSRRALDLALELEEGKPFLANADCTRFMYIWPMLAVDDRGMKQRPTLYIYHHMKEIKLGQCRDLRYCAVDSRQDPYHVTVSHDAALPEDLSWLLTRPHESGELVGDEITQAALNPFCRRGLVGQQIGGRYRLCKLIGRGGFGAVYAAQALDGSFVAVKVLECAAEEWVEEEDIQRFYREYRAVKELRDHQNIVEVHEIGDHLWENVRYPWYSMELAAGDLRGLMEDRIRRMREEVNCSCPFVDPEMRSEVLQNFEAILEGISCLHTLGECGIVHRDIKPENILVMQDGSLRIADFGLMKQLGHSGVTSTRISQTTLGRGQGTMPYVSPEQVAGLCADKASDIYSLGILLAELVSGAEPIPRFDAGQIVEPRSEGRPKARSASSIENWLQQLGQRIGRGQIPTKVISLVRGCTRVFPCDRAFADATVLLSAFRKLDMEARGRRLGAKELLGRHTPVEKNGQGEH
jgi:serine/threonine protein kinase